MSSLVVQDASTDIRTNSDGEYDFLADLVTADIPLMPGYVPYKDEGAEGFDYNSDSYVVHLVQEYARLNGVDVDIAQLRGPGGGWPSVLFQGTFNAIFDLWCAYNGHTDVDRHAVRVAVDATT